jgi:nitrous oxidase accessory protein NosD
MRRFIMAACATTFGITLSTAFAAAGPASAAVTHQARPAATIVVSPGQSIQAAVNHARPGDTILLKRGVYHQSVQIRTDGITLRGSGNSRRGTVLKPAARKPHTLCTSAFGVTGVCILAKKVNPKNGAVLRRVRNDTITGMYVTGFPANGVFGYGTGGLTVTNVSAVNDGDYGISRFVSTRTLFAGDTAVGNHEAGFYVGDSPHADTVVRDNVAVGNQFGIFVRHARHVLVFHNLAVRNCEGILVLDDGQKGGAGNAAILRNVAAGNNKFCPKTKDTPVNVQGGGILLLGATHSLVAHNAVSGNAGRQFNSGGIVVLSATRLTHGSNPNHDTIAVNRAFHNQPADLIWDGTGVGVHFVANHCGTSMPAGLCH